MTRSRRDRAGREIAQGLEAGKDVVELSDAASADLFAQIPHTVLGMAGDLALEGFSRFGRGLVLLSVADNDLTYVPEGALVANPDDGLLTEQIIDLRAKVAAYTPPDEIVLLVVDHQFSWSHVFIRRPPPAPLMA